MRVCAEPVFRSKWSVLADFLRGTVARDGSCVSLIGSVVGCCRSPSREEFRAPLGVRKSPRNEPAGADDGLWVFLFSAERGEVTTGSGKRGT